MYSASGLEQPENRKLSTSIITRLVCNYKHERNNFFIYNSDEDTPVDNIQSLPPTQDCSVNWAEQLHIPTRFSSEASEAIKSGVMTRAARVEINTSVATMIMVYTIRPTPDDMNTVCWRLLQKYPKLRDNSSNGYVSIIPVLYHACMATRY